MSTASKAGLNKSPKKEGDPAEKKKGSEEIKSDFPLSEKDEVKEAENRTRKATKGNNTFKK